MYAITIIVIITVLYDFNTFYDTLRIATLNILKTEIFNFVTLITHKSRDILFIRNKAISLLNT